MKALVTGATGLIGSHLVRALIDRGHRVRAQVRATSDRSRLAGLPIEFVVADMLDADLEAVCSGCDAVFHTAAHFAYAGVDRATLHRTAVTGTERLLQASARAGVRQVVVTSSPWCSASATRRRKSMKARRSGQRRGRTTVRRGKAGAAPDAHWSLARGFAWTCAWRVRR